MIPIQLKCFGLYGALKDPKLGPTVRICWLGLGRPGITVLQNTTFHNTNNWA